MSITETIEIFKKLLKETNNRKEIKLYKGFITILSNLKSRDLTENQSQLIQEKLSSLNLKATTENRKKYFKQKLSEFRVFLKNEFSFTTEKYYTELGMIYGMIFGTGVGMVFGMIYGARKDIEAKRQGKVI